MPRSKHTCGIYKITLLKDGRTYVGSSYRIESRIEGHKWSLKRNEHHSIYLQRVWNKYGKTAFSFSVVEVCAIDDLLIREQHYIDTLKPVFNTALIAGTRRGVTASASTRAMLSKANKGRKVSAETLVNMKAAQQKRALELTPQEKEIMLANLRRGYEQPGVKDKIIKAARLRGLDPVIRAKISAGKKGKPGWTPTLAQRQHKSKLLKGRKTAPLSEDVKIKISLAVKERQRLFPRQRDVNGVFVKQI